ncbi:MAG: cytochrome d ubiquinol oxidase subunit II [Acidimicrobiia bacterium]
MMVEAILLIIWIGVTAYALFGGADFGAGIWDLLAGGPKRGAPVRDQLERSIGPVWEANHVWLIFVLVYLWTAFPEAFVSIMTTMYIPMMLAAFGIIFRGSAFAFRKWAPSLSRARIMGAAFAGASLLTPAFLGAVVGGVASGRVPPGNAAGDPWTSWLNPTSGLGASMAVVVCAYLAAVLTSRDSVRAGDPNLAKYFRVRALVAGVVAGALALAGILVIRVDAPLLFDGLIDGLGLAIIVGSALAGVASLLLIRSRKYSLARVGAAIATTLVIWGWGVGQYPWLLPGYVTVEQGAASDAVLASLVVAFVAASLIAVPALLWLFTLTERGDLDEGGGQRPNSSDALLATLGGDRASAESEGTSLST